MTLAEWLTCASTDAARRGLPELEPMLEALARAAVSLRTAPWSDDASADTEGGVGPAGHDQ